MVRFGVLALALSAAAFAQQGGTFETSAPTQVVPAVRPIVTTPTLTLSNGFSPATVNMPQTLVSEQPQQMVTGVPQSEEYVPANATSAAEPSAPDFNFGSVSEGSAYELGGGVSLADIAKRFNRMKVQAHKIYTNEDIDRMNDEAPSNGIISARFANGQPIVAKNQGGFSPLSGIANMPDSGVVNDGDQLANGQEQNPMSEGQSNATASNADQGQQPGQDATMPSAVQQPSSSNSSQQTMPASDQPHM